MAIKICQLCAVDFTLKHFLIPLIDGMIAEGWQVMAVCSRGPYAAELRARGYQIENIEIERSFKIRAHLKAIWQLYQLFRRERFDVVHVHTPVAALIGRIAAKLAGVPHIVYTAHGFYFHDEMPRTKRFAHIILERFGGWFTDLLLTQSQEDAAAAIKYKFVSKDKVLAIGNGVDINKFNPSFYTDSVSTRASLGIPADAFVIGMIGRFVREKGYLEFLTAAQQLAGVNVNVYFLLVGQRLPSDHDDSIESALYEAQRVISTRMLLTGFRSDTPALLSAMDVFCLPSHREGMPRTIIEAMMMAKPVVATDIRGSREQVLHNETGYLVPTKNVSALAEHLQKLITNPKTGVHFGELGRERALQLYDEQVVIRKQINVIKNLTQQYAVSNAK